MAVDYYLKLDGINGEATSQGFEQQIQLLSFSWGGSQVSSVAGTTGSGAGKVDLADLSVMKHYDSASPLLFKSLCSGTHVPTAVLSATKSTGAGKPTAFLTITLSELFITSLQDSGSSEIPSESVSFSYAKIEIDYSVQNADGNLNSTGAITYDLKKNTVS